VYFIHLLEYLVWTEFNKYLLTLLTHHGLHLLSGLITGCALATFLSWVASITASDWTASFCYLAFTSYAFGHSVCGLIYYTHRCARRPPTDSSKLRVLSLAGYTGVFLGSFAFSFWIPFPTAHYYWSAVVFPCFVMGCIAQHSGIPEIESTRQPFREHQDHQEQHPDSDQVIHRPQIDDEDDDHQDQARLQRTADAYASEHL
jgi:hypothetical protein